MGSCLGKKEKEVENAQTQENQGSSEIKLLLLGAGESGKSTLFRQMKIIHHKGFTESEYKSYRDVVRANCAESMKSLITGAEKLSIPLDEKNKEIADKISKFNQETFSFISKIWNDQLGQEMEELWKDAGIQSAYLRSNEFQLNDSTKYYFDQIQTITKSEYLPSSDDILRCRIKTTGIIETDVGYDGIQFKLFDVGGQRNERKKWIHCFDNCNGVIFVVSLSEYDQKCYEDDSTLRMRESLVLFDEICNSRYFQATKIVLFFNKNDIFEQKIKEHDLNICFKNYKGGKNYQNALEYIQNEFREKNHIERREINMHVTCATDTENIKRVFEKIKDYIK